MSNTNEINIIDTSFVFKKLFDELSNGINKGIFISGHSGHVIEFGGRYIVAYNRGTMNETLVEVTIDENNYQEYLDQVIFKLDLRKRLVRHVSNWPTGEIRRIGKNYIHLNENVSKQSREIFTPKMVEECRIVYTPEFKSRHYVSTISEELRRFCIQVVEKAVMLAVEHRLTYIVEPDETILQGLIAKMEVYRNGLDCPYGRAEALNTAFADSVTNVIRSSVKMLNPILDQLNLSEWGIYEATKSTDTYVAITKVGDYRIDWFMNEYSKGSVVF